MDTPKIRDLARSIGVDGPEVVMLLIKGMLADFLDFTGAEWTPDMIESLLDLIRNNYGHLTLAQWKLFWVKAKSGKFAQEGQRDGQTMIARITPMILSQWLLGYSARCEEANEEFYAHQQRNLPERPKEGKYVSPERIAAELRAFTDKWEQELRKQPEPNNEAINHQRKKALENLLRKECQAKGLDFDEVYQEIQSRKKPAA